MFETSITAEEGEKVITMTIMIMIKGKKKEEKENEKRRIEDGGVLSPSLARSLACCAGCKRGHLSVK